jgi:hypothetical protein
MGRNPSVATAPVANRMAPARACGSTPLRPAMNWALCFPLGLWIERVKGNTWDDVDGRLVPVLARRVPFSRHRQPVAERFAARCEPQLLSHR